MKESVKNEWVKALRSGKYKQTLNSLQNNAGHCCLGVLCEISGLGKFEPYEGNERWKDESSFYLNENTMLPKEVMDYAEIKYSDGSFTIPSSLFPDGVQGKALTTINDNGATFTEIADIIEKDWENL